MACTNPLTAYRPALGGPVRFQYPKDGRAYTRMELPCGQCILCRLEHARQWAVRITHEASLHDDNSFITLTYEDKHIPEHGSLQYEDLQKFWKRLRKEIGKLRYFAVGEYGDKENRPHYHACIFGHSFTENRQMLRRAPNALWTNEVLQNAWGLGHVSVGTLNFVTAQYTASYVTKKLNNARRYRRVDEATGELIDLVQPRAFMSLRPAIGLDWLTQYGDAVYAHDHVVANGRAQKPPRYYDRWLEKRSELALQMIKEGRKQQAERKTPEQNRARARNAHARAKQRVKSL
ncbi:MAG: replication initiator protein [Arizlama microvirus]|nr:MAG: replication initiator protein [Arizlama microvirus]